MAVVVGATAVAAILGRSPLAHAGDPARPRPPVRLELAACLADAHDAIERAVQVEVGEPPDASDASAIAVAVECVAGGIDAGVVVEVRPPGNPRRYRYALDWRAQPPDARPRLIGLAVAEAVDASRIELIAVPEPPIGPGPGPGPGAGRGLDTTIAPPAASDWRIAAIGVRRAFSAEAGVDFLGVGLMPSRRLSPRLAISADLIAETATVITASGAVRVFSVSSAPRIAVRIGGRLHGELGAAARIGVVRMRGEALPGSRLGGASQVRPWFGPAADIAVGIDLVPRLSLRASAELGVVAIGATARDFGVPVATLSGTWTSLGLAAAVEL
jgi:hypothetical protein